LQNYRDILVWLPTSYEDDSRRYPVIYMHDGQNLFDQATSFAEEWGVDETMQLLGAEGIEAIIVGIPNMGPQRLAEYSPFRDVFHGQGKGERYLSFLVDTVKPLIDRDFHTLPTATHTGIMGSSMGGLISLYGFFHHPEVFGFAGVMSPSFWFADRAIYDYVRRAPFVPGRVYLDVGTREYGGSFSEREARRRSRRYYASVRRMKRILVKKGYRPVTDLMSVEERWAAHDERAWARRLPDALRFLLRGATSSALRLPSQDDKP
jgi:predicted alpha/beta superfamily hydrolase